MKSCKNGLFFQFICENSAKMGVLPMGLKSWHPPTFSSMHIDEMVWLDQPPVLVCLRGQRPLWGRHQTDCQQVEFNRNFYLRIILF
jgi:hypothetical protein